MKGSIVPSTSALAAFKDSLARSSPPADLAPPLVALWRAGRGEWDAAHTLAQDASSRDAAWVHAYLHRQEGDRFNAAYWYRRAGRPVADGPLEDEWEAMAATLLGDNAARCGALGDNGETASPLA